MNLKDVIHKLEIVFAQKPKIDDWKAKLKEPIKPYKKITKTSNIYLRVEGRLFYSPTLSLMYQVQPKEIKQGLIKYILEGITITEDAIENIVITTKRGKYHIGDIFEVVGSEINTENFKDL